MHLLPSWLFAPKDHCHIIIPKIFFLPDGLVQICPKSVTNHRKVKDHVISVLDPLSSHVYCHQKVRLEKKRIRLMNSTECVSVKWKRWCAPALSNDTLSRFCPVTFRFFKTTLLLDLDLEYTLKHQYLRNKQFTNISPPGYLNMWVFPFSDVCNTALDITISNPFWVNSFNYVGIFHKKMLEGEKSRNKKQ